MKPLAECRLYAFVDTTYLDGRRAADIAQALCDGGADLVQVRAKGMSRPEVCRLAQEVLAVTSRAGIWMVVNDHPDIAAEVGAPICHLGQEDFFGAGYTDVRAVLPGKPNLLFGLSTHAPEQAERAVSAGPAYVAVGPVFPTHTKPGRPAVTLDYVRWAATHLHLPWFAIGGITLENLPEVVAAGARRICVVGAILRSADVARACQLFRDRLTSALA